MVAVLWGHWDATALDRFAQAQSGRDTKEFTDRIFRAIFVSIDCTVALVSGNQGGRFVEIHCRKRGGYISTAELQHWLGLVDQRKERA